MQKGLILEEALPLTLNPQLRGFPPHIKFSLGAHAYTPFRQKLEDELELSKYGLDPLMLSRCFSPLFPSGRYIMWYQQDMRKTLDGMRSQFSAKDVEGIKEVYRILEGLCSRNRRNF